MNGIKRLTKNFYFYESNDYNKIDFVVTREIKRNNFIMPFDY